MSAVLIYFTQLDTNLLKVVFLGSFHFLGDILCHEITLHLCILVWGISPDVSALAD